MNSCADAQVRMISEGGPICASDPGTCDPASRTEGMSPHFCGNAAKIGLIPAAGASCPAAASAWGGLDFKDRGAARGAGHSAAPREKMAAQEQKGKQTRAEWRLRVVFGGFRRNWWDSGGFESRRQRRARGGFNTESTESTEKTENVEMCNDEC